MNIVEIMKTTSMNGLTLSEMRAKVRMNIALKAFGKWQKVVEKVKPIIKKDNVPDIKKDFYDLFSKQF